MAAALFSSLVSIARSCIASSTLFRPLGNPVPTMHSLRVHGGQRGCPAGGSFFEPRRRAPSLRIVRSSGRMVISGRMADVCAELDRLAALESAGA